MFDCVSLVVVVVVVVSVAVVLSIVWCCSYPCWLLGHVLFGELCESSPAATRLTVYRRPQVPLRPTSVQFEEEHRRSLQGHGHPRPKNNSQSSSSHVIDPEMTHRALLLSFTS